MLPYSEPRSFYDSGDSFSLLSSDGKQILNLNDCAVDTAEKVGHVRASLGEQGARVDVLLTQFGYANWIGNDADVALRRKAAAEKIQRVALQVESLTPRMAIPFASFVSFCHEENAYMNDAQNTVDDLVDSPLAASFRDRFHVMQPSDRWDPASDANSVEVRAASEQARAHWRIVANSGAMPLLRQRSQIPLAELTASADKFRAAIGRNLAWTNRLMERLGVIRPVTLHLTDLNERLEMSYRRGLRSSTDATAHFSCTSEVLEFMLKNEFGFNTTLVNGRFRTNDMAGYSRAWRFFILQDLKKMGLSASTPWTTLGVIARNVKKYIVRRVS